MQTEQKEDITKLLILRRDAQELSLKQISKMSRVGAESTISDIINRKWVERNHISEGIWNKLASWLGYKEWIIVPIANTTAVVNMCRHVRRTAQSIAISDEPGLSKSQGFKQFRDTTKNAFLIEGDTWWTKKVFLHELLNALGKSADGGIPDMMRTVIETLKQLDRPVVILDQADRLKDGVIDLFISMYNSTLDRCGFVLSGTPHLIKRIDKGLRLNKMTYKELYSRVGGEFLTLHKLDIKSVMQICRANGIEDAEEQTEIFNKCNSDLRRVKSLILTKKLFREVRNES